VLNSVAQYLPDVDYLLEVLSGAARTISARGSLFIGDLRHLAHVSMFHASVQLSKASARTTLQQLKNRIVRAATQDKELVLDPAFFQAIAAHLGMGSVEILLKRGRSDNELTHYRYDVVMRREHIEMPPPETFDASGTDAMERLASHLATYRPSALTLRAVPNLRLARDLAAWRSIQSSDERTTVGQLLSQLEKQAPHGIDPETLWTLGEEHGYHVQVSWTPGVADGSFDVEFAARAARIAQQAATPNVELPEGWRSLASDPLRALSLQQLGSRLRGQLLRVLPDYMVPAQFVVLDRLPLNANGKLDRKALPEWEHVDAGRYEPPQGKMEEILAALWSEVLGVQRVGRDYDFFEIGGHSLALIQVRALLAQRHGCELPVQTFFDHRTLRLLAAEALRSGARIESTKELRLARMRGLIRDIEDDSDAG